MNCKNCNTELSDSMSFCTVCGTPVEKPQPVYQTPSYQQPVYQQPPVIVQNPVTYNQGEVAPVTKISSYIGWTLVPYIPVVGIILAIVFAVSSQNKNRANYFRAMFLLGLIAAVLVLLPFIFIAISNPYIIEDISREISYMI